MKKKQWIGTQTSRLTADKNRRQRKVIIRIRRLISIPVNFDEWL